MKTGYVGDSVFIFIAIISLTMLVRCSTFSQPSDPEAITLVKNYYLYFHGRQTIDAKILKRRAYNKECACYPVEFELISSNHNSFLKTFYFFENEFGDVDIREYQFGIKHISSPVR